MEKTLELLLGAWNSIKSGSLTVELAQNSASAKVSIDRENFQLDILEPRADLLQALKNFITCAIKAKTVIPEPPELEKIPLKERLEKFKELFKALEPYAKELAIKNKNFILKYKGKEVLVVGSSAKTSLLKLLGVEKITVPHKLAFLKLVKELKK